MVAYYAVFISQRSSSKKTRVSPRWWRLSAPILQCLLLDFRNCFLEASNSFISSKKICLSRHSMLQNPWSPLHMNSHSLVTILLNGYTQSTLTTREKETKKKKHIFTCTCKLLCLSSSSCCKDSMTWDSNNIDPHLLMIVVEKLILLIPKLVSRQR